MPTRPTDEVHRSADVRRWGRSILSLVNTVGSAAPQVVLEVKDLHKSFGDLTAVDGVGFRIRAGETFGLLGPNGAGKTTTISMVAGLLTADSGSITVAGRPMTPSSIDAKADIGLVPQEIALYPDLTARENLTFFAKLQGLAGDTLKERVDEVLEVVGLTDRAKDRIDTFSGGMKRRANIGVGLLHEPRLLILDEPTVGVDPQSRNSILESVEVLGGRGMAVLYTTHYMEEAERLCDRIAIIDAGRIVDEGTRDELVASIGEAATLSMTATGTRDAMNAWAAQVEARDGVSAVRTGSSGMDVVAADVAGLIAPVASDAAANHVAITGVEVNEPDLEAVFLHLTGKALRD